MGRGTRGEEEAAAASIRAGPKVYKLLDADGRTYESAEPGLLGGYRKAKIYGRLDCPSALSWIAKGHYMNHRVFFRDEATAIAAGYRPCARCMPEEYAVWKAGW